MNLIAYIGTYADGPGQGAGGIDIVAVDGRGHFGEHIGRTDGPDLAGYLIYGARNRMLYAVNEQKNDGRGPVRPAAAVHAFYVEDNGSLTARSVVASPGPRPTYLTLDEDAGTLVSANHGDFDHVERVVRTDTGWDVEYVYDDSTVVLYNLDGDGDLAGIRDLVVTTGHGVDPNSSPQAGGHGQASSHAHAAVLDPSGKWLAVCDKGTDTLTTYAVGDTLTVADVLQLPPETGPRHLVFSADGTRAFMTCEFASTIASLSFNAATGTFEVLDHIPTVASDHTGLNEPADIRLHPSERFVYVNNRGEDSLAWFAIDTDGRLTRVDHVTLSKSVHPGLAARSFMFDPTGSFVLIADRPANAVRTFSVDPDTGALHQAGGYGTADPAFVLLVDLDQTEGVR